MNNADHLFSLRFVYTIGAAAIIAIVASYCIFPTNNAAELKNMMRRLLLDMDDFIGYIVTVIKEQKNSLSNVNWF